MYRAIALSIIVFLGVGNASCGSDGKAPIITDGSPDADLCGCPGSEPLEARNIERELAARTSFPPGPGVGTGIICEDDQVLTGTGCISLPVTPLLELMEIADTRFFPHASICGWNVTSSDTREIRTNGFCLDRTRPEPVPPSSGTCTCLPVEPAADRVLRIEEGTVTIAANAVSTAASSCEPEQVLLGGLCILGGSGARFSSVSTMSYKYGTDHATWACSWRNNEDTSYAGSAVAICMRPPSPGMAPEKVPLIDRLVLVQNEVSLPANDFLLVDATCQPGDSLLVGGCAIDDPESHMGVTMFRGGILPVEQNRPNTWQCGWNNQSAQTPKAIATAVCLKPIES